MQNTVKKAQIGYEILSGQKIFSQLSSVPEEDQPKVLLEILSSVADLLSNRESLETLLEEISGELKKPLCSLLETLLIESIKSYRSVSTQRQTEDSSTSHPTTKELILSAALEVFAARGYHNTTVDDIAKKAGIAKGSIYRYFQSKEALFNEVLESRIESLDNSIQRIIREEGDIIQIIGKCVEAYLAFFENNQGIYQLLFREKSSSERQQYLKRAFKRLLPIRKKIFEASRKGLFKPISFEFIFYGFMGFIHGIIQRWTDHGCSYSLAEEAPAILEVLFNGTVLNKNNLNFKEEKQNGQSSN
ncbi:MAG: TetR/AcrR family transcriptional regulator [Thermodesulforhabdaceae bacterium]